MFATTAGEVHRESFCEPLRSSELIPAQPRCIFGNGDDTESSRSGARSERVCWKLFSLPCFREAAVAWVSQQAGGTRVTQGGGRSVRTRD